jgi:hypothetical protein
MRQHAGFAIVEPVGAFGAQWPLNKGKYQAEKAKILA